MATSNYITKVAIVGVSLHNISAVLDQAPVPNR